MFNTIHFDENKKNGKTTSNVSLSWIKAVSGKQGILGIKHRASTCKRSFKQKANQPALVFKKTQLQ